MGIRRDAASGRKRRGASEQVLARQCFRRAPLSVPGRATPQAPSPTTSTRSSQRPCTAQNHPIRAQRHSPSSPLPRRIPTTSSPSHPGLLRLMPPATPTDMPNPIPDGIPTEPRFTPPPGCGTSGIALPSPAAVTGRLLEGGWRPEANPKPRFEPEPKVGTPELASPPFPRLDSPNLGATAGGGVQGFVSRGSLMLLDCADVILGSVGDVDACVPAPSPVARLIRRPGAMAMFSPASPFSAALTFLAELSWRLCSVVTELPLCRDSRGAGRLADLLGSASCALWPEAAGRMTRSDRGGATWEYGGVAVMLMSVGPTIGLGWTIDMLKCGAGVESAKSTSRVLDRLRNGKNDCDGPLEVLPGVCGSNSSSRASFSFAFCEFLRRSLLIILAMFNGRWSSRMECCDDEEGETTMDAPECEDYGNEEAGVLDRSLTATPF